MSSRVTSFLSESDDGEFYSCDSDMEDGELLSSDAVYSKQPLTPFYTIELEIDDVQGIDEKLDLYEKISLVYLLYEDPHIGLQQIMLLLQHAPINIIHEWCCWEKKNNDKWADKLVEALAIIQNYAVLKKLGLKKEEMIIRFMPLQEVRLYVNIVRKCCYRICEDFTMEKRDRFLEQIENDFKFRNAAYIPQPQKELYNPDYLEMYFLFYEIEKYISLDNVKNIANIFKRMDLINNHENFERLHQQIKKPQSQSANYNVDRTPYEYYQNSASTSKEEEISESEENNSGNIGNIYEIDQKYPGLLLIINNEYFHTEPRKEYADKLAKTWSQLENRKGSEADKNKLKETFRKKGFAVVTEDNLIHDEMLKVLRKTIQNFQHSCLFVAILSHGDQGVIYGANSVEIEVTNIQKIICDKTLRGIPKVLLLQACQGSDCQKLNDDENYQTDGPRRYIPPKTTDLLTFRATIPGYSAVRHTVNGTWFIQEFCEAIEKHPNDHVQNICTEVISVVSKKVWSENCMVPIMESTFTKHLYLKMPL